MAPAPGDLGLLARCPAARARRAGCTPSVAHGAARPRRSRSASPLGPAATAPPPPAARRGQCPAQPVAGYTTQAAAVFTGTWSSTRRRAADRRAARRVYTQHVEVSTVYTGRISSPTVTVHDRARSPAVLGGPRSPPARRTSSSSRARRAWTAAGGGGTSPAEPQPGGPGGAACSAHGRAPVAPRAGGGELDEVDARPSRPRISRRRRARARPWSSSACSGCSSRAGAAAAPVAARGTSRRSRRRPRRHPGRGGACRRPTGGPGPACR